MQFRASLLTFLLVSSACGGNTTTADAGVGADGGSGSSDAGTVDSSTLDAASGPDAGDAASADAGPGGDAGACTDAVDAISAALPDVLLLSESDRVIALRIFPSEGQIAPTLDTIARLAAPLPTGATTEMRTTDRFFTALEPASASAPLTAPMTLTDAVNAALTDLIYVAIHDPDPAHSAEVRVILAGRTSCGQLVWLESIAIET